MNANKALRIGGIIVALALARGYLRWERQRRAPTQENVQRAERDVRALASDSGCASAGDCTAAPAGVRACGGPRFYVVYCPRTTDTARLNRALSELKRLDSAYNQSTNAVGTCELLQPPTIVLAGRSCRAATP